MIKTLRFLLLTGIATILCVSCTKEEPPTKPINVTANPEHACAHITLVRVVKDNDNSFRHDTINTDDAQVRFEASDSLILSTTAKNGYTFINWTRDGEEASIDPAYSFKLEEDDVDADKHFIKHHYEARFGIDYALQIIPDIHDKIPLDLIKAMDELGALHFGDNPPRLDSLGLIGGRPVKNERYIPSDPLYAYNMSPTFQKAIDRIIITNQHRGVADFAYSRLHANAITLKYGSPNDLQQIKNDSINTLAEALFIVDTARNNHNIDYLSITHTYYNEYSEVKDSAFIMGEDPYFSIFLIQERKKEGNIPYTDYKSTESVIISGKITKTGIKEYYYGIKIKDYAEEGYYGMGLNKGDILISKIDSLSWYSWNPNEHYNHR